MLKHTECEKRKITELNAEKKSDQKRSVKRGMKECAFLRNRDTDIQNKHG